MIKVDTLGLLNAYLYTFSDYTTLNLQWQTHFHLFTFITDLICLIDDMEV